MHNNNIILKFSQWTKLKIKLHISKQSGVYFRDKEIWWASLGVNIGFEQDGKHENFERPILVLKKFNQYVLWALPLTSKNKVGKYYHQFQYKGKKFTVILSQLRLISSKRLLRRIGIFPTKELNQVKSLIKSFL